MIFSIFFWNYWNCFKKVKLKRIQVQFEGCDVLDEKKIKFLTIEIRWFQTWVIWRWLTISFIIFGTFHFDLQGFDQQLWILFSLILSSSEDWLEFLDEDWKTVRGILWGLLNYGLANSIIGYPLEGSGRLFSALLE